MLVAETWFAKLLGRLCIYLFILLTISFAMYLLGNFQDFLDTSQIMLIKISQFIAILFLIADMHYLFILVFRGLRKQGFMTARFILSLFGGMVAGGYLFSSKILIAWITG